MKDNLLGCLCALILGALGVVTWYVEMFTDNKVAALWRRMNGQGRIGKNYAAIGSPAFTCICFIYLLLILVEKFAPTWLTFGLACLMMLCFLVFLIALLPIRFPRWVYADWQYAKRHGLLDEKGNVDQEAWVLHHAQRRGGYVVVNLASGWRLVTPEERAELGALAGDASVRLIAVGKAKDEGNVPTLVIAGGELTTDVSDEAVYADSVQQLEKPFPGFHLIDDFEWPMTPQGARWRTGVYILNDVSLTLSQLAWITRTARVGSRSPQRFLWTATCTCPSIVFPAVIDDFMEMAQTVEVPS